MFHDRITISIQIPRQKLGKIMKGEVTNIGWNIVASSVHDHMLGIHSVAKESIYERLATTLDEGHSNDDNLHNYIRRSTILYYMGDEENNFPDELTISFPISREKLNKLMEAEITNNGWNAVGWAIENYKWDINNRATRQSAFP